MCAQGVAAPFAFEQWISWEGELALGAAWSGLQPEIELWNALSAAPGETLSPSQPLTPAVLFLSSAFAKGSRTRSEGCSAKERSAGEGQSAAPAQRVTRNPAQSRTSVPL